MAIQVNYDLTGKEGEMYPSAYLRVQKVSLSSNMVERYEEDGDNLVLTYDNVPENVAIVYVYSDAEARWKNARPVHFFGIEFEYDPDSGENVFKVAYEALKRLERFKDETIEDV